MGGVKDLIVYQKAFDVAMMVFRLARKFPPEEKYSLTSQCVRSSRSVCAQMAEAFRKRRYPLHFTSKLTDCDGENSETQTWLDFAVACEYVTREEVKDIYTLSEEVGNLLCAMINNPEKWCRKP
ncbi:MAG: four helix bundle protein [Flavobacteriales bacterium]|nr:four helix bundle protein [Flavobacteriales bacterium]